jgi:hypothetical protein
LILLLRRASGLLVMLLMRSRRPLVDIHPLARLDLHAPNRLPLISTWSKHFVLPALVDPDAALASPKAIVLELILVSDEREGASGGRRARIGGVDSTGGIVACVGSPVLLRLGIVGVRSGLGRWERRRIVLSEVELGQIREEDVIELVKLVIRHCRGVDVMKGEESEGEWIDGSPCGR